MLCAGDSNMKVLYVTKTMPEYRIKFFEELSNLVTVDFCILKEEGALRTYGIDTSMDLKAIRYISYRGIKGLKNQIENNKYTTIIIPPIDSLYLYKISLNITLYAKSRGINILYYNENWLPPSYKVPLYKKLKNWSRKILIKSLRNKIDLFLVSGSKALEYCSNELKIPTSKIRVAIESSTNLRLIENYNIRERYAIPYDYKIVLYLGRIIERKGLNILIKAIWNLTSIHEKIWLVVGGSGDDFEKYCKDLVATLKMRNITFLGLVMPQYRYQIYHEADVFVLPSYFQKGLIEAWGLTLNEALEAGTPIIATTAVGAAYDLIDEENGLIVTENNEKELQTALEKILFSNSFSRVNCIKSSQKYSVNAMAKSFYYSIKAIEENTLSKHQK